MARKKRSKDAEIIRDEILSNWNDVYGVNHMYDFMENETEDGNRHITIGLNCYSLKNEGGEEVIISFHEEDICELVERFLMEYHDLYLNYVVNQIKLNNE